MDKVIIERNWISNFLQFDHPLKYQGMVFHTVEHFYQAMKSHSLDYRQKVASAKTPGAAKRLGKSADLRPDWHDIKVDVMLYALTYKFAPDTTWGKKLLKTSGSIVEWNYWHDNFWGNCRCNRCKNIHGENWLGGLLMTIRTQLNSN